MNITEQKLLKVAQVQLGFFTSKQAVKAGFRSSNHPYHVKVKDWVREFRGIYRLSSFPPSPYDQMIVFYLWSMGKRGRAVGFYSYDTALSIHELSDINPPLLHMTVPLSFRRAIIPEVLVLHRESCAGKEVVDFYGMKVTSPGQTIIDIVREKSLDPFLISQAVQEANRKGLLLKKHIVAYPEIEKFL